MKRLVPFFVTILALINPVLVADDIYNPKREFRSVWLTTAIALDWPKTEGPATQEEELREYIQEAKDIGLNAVIFQVNARADAMYQSERLPWAPWLTGTPGEDPGWDPLAVAIEEAHGLGMELHAWFNVGLVGSDHTPRTDESDPPHVTYTNPDWIDRVGTNDWLNLGIPGARQWQVDNVLEIVENYNIDAVHFDYIRYHHREGYERDDSLFQEHNPEDIVNINDWRRWNVTQFVKSVYAEIQGVKPWLRVGSAVIGHYRNIPQFTWGAFYGYTDTYQDGRLWVEEKVHDYLAPMIYWGIGVSDDSPRFEIILQDWMQETETGHIYAGMAPYKEHVHDELYEQIDTVRAKGAHGGVYFRFDHIRDENTAFENRYKYPSIIPSMEWKDSLIAPIAAPDNFDFWWDDEETVLLEWDAPPPPVYGDDLIRYAVYRINAASPPIFPDDLDSGEHLLSVQADRFIEDTPPISDDPYYYVVTALDRNHSESEPSDAIVLEVTTVPDDLIAGTYSLYQNYPNPFNPETNIRFTIPHAERVTMKVYYMLGREVEVLVDEQMYAGEHTVRFDASQLPSGVYIYRIKAGEFTESKRMIFAK